MGVFQQTPWVSAALPYRSRSLDNVADHRIESASFVVHISGSYPVTYFRYSGFDWSLLPEGSLVIDVGAGDGSEMFEVAKIAPHLKLMIQDREQTIQEVTTPVRASSIAIVSILELTVRISLDLA